MRVRHRVLLALIGLWVCIFYRFRAHGMEHIPQQGGCVIAASHSGKLLADMFAFLAVARRRTPAVIMPTTPGGVRMRGGGGWFPRLMQSLVPGQCEKEVICLPRWDRPIQLANHARPLYSIQRR